MRFFNTAGPIRPQDQYYIPHRLNEAEVYSLIAQKKYFILHAPRQSGKTTAIIQFVKQLNSEGNYIALYVNVEPAQIARSNVNVGMRAILSQIKTAIATYLENNEQIGNYLNSMIDNYQAGITGLSEFLHYWCSTSPKPIILFIDEIDSLVGDTLLSVLRQLRAGYPDRPECFPQSVILVGVRDVRDYRIWSDENQQHILGGSAFNIKAESLTLADFTLEQVRDLYEQHTQETGQKFTQEAIEYAYYLTQGQPWLVNALAYQACFKDIQDRSIAITKEIIERSKEELILRRDTHIDVLIDRLAEPRVRAIIDAIISGSDVPEDFPTDDISYCSDLGIISRTGKKLKIANLIYQEVIPRELVYGTQRSITQETRTYVNPDGSLNMLKLMEKFQEFYRANSAIWLEKFNYKESGPHLFMMAFLQRVINACPEYELSVSEDQYRRRGGKIHREYALGRKRVDLLLEWREQRIIIELKILRSEKTILDGLDQTADYMQTCNATEGHLVIFDRSVVTDWDRKIFSRQEKVGNRIIMVWGM